LTKANTFRLRSIAPTSLSEPAGIAGGTSPTRKDCDSLPGRLRELSDLLPRPVVRESFGRLDRNNRYELPDRIPTGKDLTSPTNGKNLRNFATLP